MKLTVSPRKRKRYYCAISCILSHLLTPELVSSEWIDSTAARTSEVNWLTVFTAVVHRSATYAKKTTSTSAIASVTLRSKYRFNNELRLVIKHTTLFFLFSHFNQECGVCMLLWNCNSKFTACFSFQVLGMHYYDDKIPSNKTNWNRFTQKPSADQW